MPNQAFDRIARVAARTLACPIAMIWLQEGARMRIGSSFGLSGEFSENHAALSGRFLSEEKDRSTPTFINDIRRESSVSSNFAAPELNVVAYAGIPLRDPRG